MAHTDGNRIRRGALGGGDMGDVMMEKQNCGCKKCKDERARRQKAEIPEELAIGYVGLWLFVVGYAFGFFASIIKHFWW